MLIRTCFFHLEKAVRILFTLFWKDFTKILISREHMVRDTWNFLCTRRISRSFRSYHSMDSSVSHNCTDNCASQRYACVTGCEHNSYRIFVNAYLSTESSRLSEIWHVHSHMSSSNGGKRKKLWKQRKVLFLWLHTKFPKKRQNCYTEKEILWCVLTILKGPQST